MRRFILTLVSLVFIVLFLLVSTAISRTPPAAVIPVPTVQADTSAIIPIYPGAEVLLNYTNPQIPGSRSFSLRVISSTEEVASFYKKILLITGWTLSSDTVRANEDRYLEFTTSSIQNKITIRNYAQIIISNRGSQTDVVVNTERIPDPDTLPIYQDAQEIMTKWDKEPIYHYVRRLTNYITKANQVDIKKYYMETMANIGWVPVPDGSSADMVFINNRLGNKVSIHLTPEQYGETLIELAISGNGFEQPPP